MATNDEMLLHAMTTLVSSHSKAVSRFGATVVVMGKFIDAVLPLLSAVQAERAVESFRMRVDASMRLTDDTALPPEFHETMLEQTHTLLNNLQGSARMRDGVQP